MSDLLAAVRHLVHGATVLAACAATAAAQAPSTETVRLTLLVRTLRDSITLIEREEKARAIAERDRVRDTIRVGPFTVAADRVYSPVARLAADTTWAHMRRRYGARPTAAAVASVVFVIHADSIRRPLYWERSMSMSTRTPRAVEREESFDPNTGLSPREAISAYLDDRVVSQINASSDRRLRSWIQASQAVGGVDEEVMGSAFIQLQTAGSVTARDCSAGNLRQCASALALVDPPDPFDVVFTAADRRDAGRRQFELFRLQSGGSDTTRNPCDDSEPDAVCERYVRGFSVSWFPAMGNGTRAALLVTALDLGGEDALDRLLADTTAPMQLRLAAAAGVSRDSLLSRWRTRVLRAEPEPVTPSARVVLASLAWGLGFACLSLRRARAG